MRHAPWSRPFARHVRITASTISCLRPGPLPTSRPSFEERPNASASSEPISHQPASPRSSSPHGLAVPASRLTTRDAACSCLRLAAATNSSAKDFHLQSGAHVGYTTAAALCCKGRSGEASLATASQQGGIVRRWRSAPAAGRRRANRHPGGFSCRSESDGFRGEAAEGISWRLGGRPPFPIVLVDLTAQT